MNNQSTKSQGFLDRLRREPLIHFLGLAALLFVANAWLSGDEREIIAVDTATREYLVDRQQEMMLRELTESEKKQAVENFIEEEILVREARKRGFENSSRIRQLLIQNMRFFMASEVPEPTEEELRQFFDDNIERFESPPSVTYEHVYFSDPASIPAGTLELLRGGTDYRQIGEADYFSTRISRAGEQQIVTSFGREQAPEILGISDDLWHGTFISPNGAHFFRVAERHPASRPDWETASNWIATEWLSAKNREVVDREMALMRQNYRIEIEPAEAAAE